MNRFQDNRNQVPWQPHPKNGWELSQFKHYYNITLGKMLQNDSVTSLDIEVPYLKAQHVQWDRVLFDELPTMWASPHDIETLQIKKGDLLVCEGGEVGRAAIVNVEPPINCIIQNAIHLVHPKLKGEVRFLKYLLQNATTNKWLDVLCNRATIAHFTVEKFSQMRAWFPLLSEQKNIADYLDHETAYIDTLINAKLRFIGLLEEKRQALIAYVVMHGSNSNVPMRNTGLPWLGEIPKHWELEFARWLFDEIDERSETGDEELLSVSHLTGVTPRSEKDVNMFMAETNEGYKVCQPGDLVINTLWAWMGAMGVAFQHGLVSPAYNVYRPTGRYNPRYLDFLVRVPNFAKEATRYSKGVWSSRLRLYPEEFFLIQMPVPPLDEQQEIVDYLDGEISKIDQLSQATQSSIALLSERRTALISAAVTGQIEIPEASCN